MAMTTICVPGSNNKENFTFATFRAIDPSESLVTFDLAWLREQIFCYKSINATMSKFVSDFAVLFSSDLLVWEPNRTREAIIEMIPQLWDCAE